MSLRWASACAILFPAAYGTLLLDESTAFALTDENGFFENATSVALAMGAAVTLALYVRSRGAGNDLGLIRTKRNVSYLLLTLAFFIGAAEEISWGQQIIGFETPAWIRSVNVNDETNLHNLVWFDRRGVAAARQSPLLVWVSIDRLFSVFWLTFCFLIPLLTQTTRPVARLANRVNLPLAPLGLGVLFPVNYACSRLLEPWAASSPDSVNRPVIEVKEFVFSVLFLLLFAYWAAGSRQESSTKA